jgi:hypothetical protein
MDNNPNFNNATTDTQADNSNINYNDTNTYYNYNNGSTMTNDGVSSASYTNTPAHTNNITGSVPIPDLSSQSFPTTSSNPSQSPQQYNGQNVTQFIQNNPSQINHSGNFTFDIPGIKIIIIPVFSSMTNSSQAYHSEIFTFDIPGTKVIIITLSFQ